MWLLLSIFSLVIVGTIGQGPDEVITANPIIPEDIGSSEEIPLPEEIVTISPEDIDFSEEEEIPDDIENPNSIESDEVEEIVTISPEDIDFSEEEEIPDDIENPNSIESDEVEEISSIEEGNLDDENPTVVITQGTVVGSYSDDGSYAQFYGIPFADGTSGRNRFKAPNPPPSFQDTFIANRRDIKCVRALGAGYEGTEDCLVANVFTSALENVRRLPVMVWVKGKEFDQTYEYEPSFKNFVDQDVVVVTLNYRESVLGFLCLGTETAPGNAGLKDIIAGLRWVQENIAQFGGNPNDITLVGHGSGAAAVDLVSLSPMANGMIHKVIAQSGNALSPWAVSRDNVHYAIQVAEALGHIITDIEELSAIFERTSVAALMGVINDLDLTDNSLAFAPCLERDDLEDVEPFMIRSPYQILLEGEFNPIPFITGYVDNEGTIRSAEAIENHWLERMSESFSDFIQPDLKFETDEEKTQIAQRIKSFYFHDDPIDMEHVENYIKYHGDTMIMVSALREVRLRAVSAPVYLYQFSYKGFLGEPFVGPLEVDRAAHSEELAYQFHDKSNDEIYLRDQTIGDILVERWGWFSKTGLPMSSTSSVFWRAYTTSDTNYIRVLDNEEINEQSAFEVPLRDPHPELLTFWNEIYETHFLDAEGIWDWTEREEDEDENEGSGDDDENNSASSAVGYTFSIITLFTILNKILSSQILS